MTSENNEYLVLRVDMEEPTDMGATRVCAKGPLAAANHVASQHEDPGRTKRLKGARRGPNAPQRYLRGDVPSVHFAVYEGRLPGEEVGE